MEVSCSKFQENPSSGSRADADIRTDMTQVIGAFHEYGNPPKADEAGTDPPKVLVCCSPESRVANFYPFSVSPQFMGV
jgi:hypothetical protein